MKSCRNILVLVSILFVSAVPVPGQKVQPAQSGRRTQMSRTEMKQGFEFYKQARYNEAENIFLQVLKDEPKNLLAKEMLAAVYYHTQNVEQARKYALLTLRQNKRSAHAYLVLAWIAGEQKKYLAARDFLIKAERLAQNEMVVQEINQFKENFKTSVQANITAPAPAAVAASATGRIYLAIFPFEDNRGGTETNDIGNSIAEMLITALTPAAQYRIMERAQLDKILEEQALGQSGALEQQTAVEVGKLAGVQAILVGSVSRLGKRLEIDSRIVDAGSGEIRNAASSSADDEEDLRQAVNHLAQKITADDKNKPVR